MTIYIGLVLAGHFGVWFNLYDSNGLEVNYFAGTLFLLQLEDKKIKNGDSQSNPLLGITHYFFNAFVLDKKYHIQNTIEVNNCDNGCFLNIHIGLIRNQQIP